MKSVKNNLIKLKNDIINLTTLDGNNKVRYNYVTVLNNIIELLFENEKLLNGNYEEYLSKTDIEYLRQIFSDDCLTFKEQNCFIKMHDMSLTENRNSLIKGCLWIPSIMSLYYIGNGIDYIDLLQQGVFGIDSAINKRQNIYTFSSLVKMEVNKSLRKYIRKNGKYGYISDKELDIYLELDSAKEKILMNQGFMDDIAFYLDCPNDRLKEMMALSNGYEDIEIVNSNSDNTFYSDIIDVEDEALKKIDISDILLACNSVLNDKEKFVFYHFYGINNNVRMSYKEISLSLKCSCARVYQILDRSLIKIKQRYKVILNERCGLMTINDIKKLRMSKNN